MKQKSLLKILAAFLCLFLLALPACGAKEKTGVQSNRDRLSLLKLKAPQDAWALVLPDPSQSQQEAFSLSAPLVQNEKGKIFLLVPLEEAVSWTLEQVIWSNAQQAYVAGRQLFEGVPDSSGSGLLLQAQELQGKAQLRLRLKKDQESLDLYWLEGTFESNQPYWLMPKAPGQAPGPIEGEDPHEAAPPEGEEKPAVERSPMTFEEIAPIFSLTEAEVLGHFGQPSRREPQEVFEGMTFMDLYYGSAVISLDAEEGGHVYSAVFSDNLWAGPREIRIGDSLDKVLGVLPEMSAPVGTEISENQEQLIYGDGSYMSAYGKLFFEGNQVSRLVLATEEGVIVTYVFQGQTINAIEYLMPMI